MVLDLACWTGGSQYRSHLTSSLAIKSVLDDHLNPLASHNGNKILPRFSWSRDSPFLPGQNSALGKDEITEASAKKLQNTADAPTTEAGPATERRSDVAENVHGDGSHPLPRGTEPSANAKRFSFWEHALNVAKWDEAHRGSSEPITSPKERSVGHSAESAVAELMKRFSFSEHAKNVRIWNTAHHILDHPIDQRDTTASTLRKRFNFWLHMANVQKYDAAHAKNNDGNDGHFNHGNGFIPIRERDEDEHKARPSFTAGKAPGATGERRISFWTPADSADAE